MTEFVLDGIQTEMNYEKNEMYFVHRFTKKDDNLDYMSSTIYCTMEEMKNVSFGNLQGFVLDECVRKLGEGESEVDLTIRTTEKKGQTIVVNFELSKPFSFIVSGYVTFELDEIDKVEYGKISAKVVEKLKELLDKE